MAAYEIPSCLRNALYNTKPALLLALREVAFIFISPPALIKLFDQLTLSNVLHHHDICIFSVHGYKGTKSVLHHNEQSNAYPIPSILQFCTGIPWSAQ